MSKKKGSFLLMTPGTKMWSGNSDKIFRYETSYCALGLFNRTIG